MRHIDTLRTICQTTWCAAALCVILTVLHAGAAVAGEARHPWWQLPPQEPDYLTERILAFDQFIQEHGVEVPAAPPANRTGIMQGKDATGSVWLEVTRRMKEGSKYVFYSLTVSRAREVEHRSPTNTITFHIELNSEVMGRPGRILLAKHPYEARIHKWSVTLSADGAIEKVDAEHQGKGFFGGAKGPRILIQATFVP